MKVILREDVPHLGDSGSVVNVKPGYARNYLIPQGLATQQHGLMMVYANYICHLQVNKERVAPVREDSEELRLEKRAKLWGQTTASCGTFELKENTVTVNWTTSNNPGTQGHVTDFVLSREGDRIKLAPAANPEFKVVYRKLK